MKNKVICLIILFSFYFITGTPAQEVQRELPEWVKTMKKYPVNFQLLEKQFDEYWKDKMEGEPAIENRTEENEFPIREEYGWLKIYLREYFEAIHLRMPKDPNVKKSVKAARSAQRMQVTLGAWTSMGPFSESINPFFVSSYLVGVGRVNELAFSGSHPNVMYALSPSALFISTDTANTWTSTGTDNIDFTEFQSLAVDPTNDSVIYIGCGSFSFNPDYWMNAAILKSTDFGRTFTGLTNGLDTTMINKILINPQDHNEIFACGYGGIWKSSDAGNSWIHPYIVVDSILNGNYVYDIEFKPGSSDTLFATTDTTFLISTDRGITWNQNVTTLGQRKYEGPILIGLCEAAPDIVYLASEQDNGNIYKSTDGGQTFTGVKINTSPGLTGYQTALGENGYGWYAFAFYIEPTNADKIYFGSILTHKSEDGGLSWNTNFANAVNNHPDQHYIGRNPLLSDRLWLTNDGGVYCKMDSDTIVFPMQRNLAITQAYHFDADNFYDSTFAIGTQDNGAIITNNASDFITCIGGDVYSKVFCAYNNNLAYFPGSQGRNFNMHTPLYGFPNPLPEVADFEPMSFSPLTPTTAFLANMNIWETNNLNSSPITWRQIYSSPQGYNFTAASHSLADSNLFFAIRYDGYLFKTANALDAAPVFDSVPTPTLSLWLCGIATVPNDPNTIYLAADSVWVTHDRGLTWTNITTGLSTYYSYRKIIADPYEMDGSVYVLADNKIYYKNNSTAWIEFTNQLPATCMINDISIKKYNSQKHVLWANLYGRGVWQSPAYQMLVNGVEEKEIDESAITLFPVPASTYLNVTGTNGVLLKHVVIYDAQGREVAKMKNEVSKEKLIIPVSTLSNGIYYLEVVTGKGTAMKKFVVNR